MLVVTYVYIIYPIVIISISRILKSNNQVNIEGRRAISIIIPAHNEEKVIVEKIENHLKLDYPTELFDILVISDTSSDSTVELVTKYVEAHPGKVRLFEVEDGLGKTNAINKAITSMDGLGEILVFSDANVYLEKQALHAINNAISADVGCVAGQLSYINENSTGAAASNGLYWRYEEAIKKAESDTGSMMGADGSIFALRKELYRQLPTYVLDDFCSSMGVLCQGYKLKIDHNIKAFEKGAESTAEEFPRKIRISNRSYNSYKYMRKELIKNLSVFDLWKLCSHKVLRWHCGSFMIIALLANLFLAVAENNIIWIATLVLQLAFYIAAILSWKKMFPKIPVVSKVVTISEYFLMANLAAFIGVFKSISGKKITTWKKAESTR